MFSLAFLYVASLKPMCTVLSAESCSSGDTQPAAAAAVAANQKSPSKNLHQKPCVLLQQVFYIQW
jgi:hypothetical protein